MFNLFNVALCGSDVPVWKLGASNWALWSPVGILLSLIAIGIVVYFAKKDSFKTYAKGSFILFSIATICILVADLVVNILGDTADNEGMKEFQMYNIIAGVLIVLTALVYVVANIYFKDKQTARKVVKGIAICFAISALGLLIASFSIVKDTAYWPVSDNNPFGNFDAGAQAGVTAVAFILVIAMFIYANVPSKDGSRKNETLAVVYAGISIAMSYALSYAKIVKMPAGGSVTVAALLPLALYSYMFGTKKGVMACLVYGLLQIMQDPWLVHPAQILFDYVIAYGCIGFAGVFRKIKIKPVGFALGTAIAGTLRYCSSLISGAIFFADVTDVTSPAAFSAVYNSVILIDIAIVVVIGTILLCNKQIVRVTNDVSNRYLNK